MRSNFLRDTNGAAIIEAALVLPVFVLLVFGLADFSLYLWQWNSAGKAVHVGARKAIVSTAPAALNVTWDSTKIGQLCYLASADGSFPCNFAVVSITCAGATPPTGCAPAVDKMKAVFPQLAGGEVTISYAPNRLGYVGRPGPARADVTVRIDKTYTLLFLGPVLGPGFGGQLPIRARATLPSQDLFTN